MTSTMSSLTPSIMAQGNTCTDDTLQSNINTHLGDTLGGTRGAHGPCSDSGTTSQTSGGSSSTSKRFQKLVGTFGHSFLGEKLRLYGNPVTIGQPKQQAPISPACSSSTRNNCSSLQSAQAQKTHPSSKRRRIRSGKPKPFTIDEESSEDFFESSSAVSQDQKDSGVDPGDLEEHVIVPIPLKNLRQSSSRGYGDSGKGTRYVIEVDEDLISAGFPSDLPSGLIDIEGNLLGEFDFRFGLEDDDFDSLDCDDNFGHGRSESVYSKESCGKSRKKRGNLAKTKKSSSLSKTDETNYNSGQGSSIPQQILYHSPTKLVNMAEEQSNGYVANYCNSNSQTSNSQGHEEGENTSPEEEKVLTSPQRTFVHRRRSRSPHAPLDRHHSSGATSNTSTITVHYYPEGGWGFVVLLAATSCHSLLSGMQLSFGILMRHIFNKFGEDLVFPSGWLGALSLGISLFFSPVWVSICKRKSTRLSAVFGGLVASLGCLFTSFASQFHQLFFSYGAFIGVGVGLTRDASTLMVGQYFKRKRDMVEIIVVAGSGLGIILMSVSIHSAITSLGWRLGLQAITGSLFLTFFLSTFYRSASLYHPQRRAILHLKNQKRKVKEKEKREEKPPLIDMSCLRSKTLQILLLSSAFISFGVYNPLFSLAVECSRPGLEGCSLVWLHVYVGGAWILGCLFFGLLVLQKSPDCRVSKQYLTQVASVICGISILTLTSVKGNSGMVIFSWVYGFSLGGYNYALKVYTYERVRARHFPRAWSFVQSIQAFPLLFGVPLTGEINRVMGWKYGYLLSSISIFIGAACLFLTDVRRRKMSRRKANSQNSSMKTCETTDGTQSPKSKRLSFSFPVEQPPPVSTKHESDEEDDPGGGGCGGDDPSAMMKDELTCISEEGMMADMDFQYFDEWAEYYNECITSCNKVENCLASEYDPDYAVLVERRARRWSAARQNANPAAGGGGGSGNARLNIPLGSKVKGKGNMKVLPKLFPKLNLGSRSQSLQSSSSQSPNQSQQLESPPSSPVGSEPTSSPTTVGVGPPFYGETSSKRINRIETEQNSFAAIDEDSV